jgi:hypothetical protein
MAKKLTEAQIAMNAAKNAQGKALLASQKAGTYNPPTPTPATPKSTTDWAGIKARVDADTAQRYGTQTPVYTGKVSDGYVPGTLGNQKASSFSSSSSGGSTGGDTPPPTPPPDPPIPGGGNTGLDMSYYEEMLRRQQEAIQQRINAAVDANNAYIPQVNQQSDKALQDAYILREQSRVNAPQALSALGYTGGAAETSLMGIQTGYENTRNQVEQSRAQALKQIRQNEQRIRATGDATLSEAAADYYSRLIAANEQAQRDAQAQANWEAEFGLRQKEYEDAAAQQAWQNAYDERLLGLKLNDNTKYIKVDEDDDKKIISGNYNTVWANVQRALGGSNLGSQRAFDAVINYIQQSLRSGMITEYEAQQMIGRLNL